MKTRLVGIAMAALALGGAAPLFAVEGKRVAVISGAAITDEDLNHAIGTRLMRVRTEEYNLKRLILDDLIATRLLAEEAARRHVTVDELIQQEVTAKVTLPTAAEVGPVYDGITDRFPGMTKDEALQKISDGMGRQRTAARRTELVNQLRTAAGVKIELEPPRVDVKAEGPSRGNVDAPVTIVEFSDFECPYCSEAVPTLRRLEEKYGDKVRIVHRDFPLAGHRTAKLSAAAAHCADDQGKFWQMSDALFAKGGGPMSDSEVVKSATAIGLDAAKFGDCMQTGKYKEVWKSSQEEGIRIGVQSTPSFFVNGRLVIGAASFETFSKAIDEEIQRAEAMHATAVAITARKN